MPGDEPRATDATPDLSLVLVAYRSSGVIGPALASFRDEARAAGLRGETVVVDHSGDAAEAARLRALGPTNLLLRENRGYAAGLNAGVAAARGATILAGNADIRFAPGALAALLEALGRGWDVVGPLFGIGGFTFPPADVQTPGAVVARWLASRSLGVWRAFMRRELRRCRRVWEAGAPLAVSALSGALLAFPRAAAGRVGPWDEHYFLYFEETDWLTRAAAAGMRIAQAPAARVEHLWGQAADPASSGGHYLASRSRFLASHFGWRGRLASRLPLGRTPLRPAPLTGPASLPNDCAYWLVSPTDLGIPAASWNGAAPDLLRALHEVWAARCRPTRYTVLAAERGSGRVRGPWWWEGGNG